MSVSVLLRRSHALRHEQAAKERWKTNASIEQTKSFATFRRRASCSDACAACSCVCVCFTSLFRFILCDHSPLLLAMEEENRAHRRSRPVFTFLISCAVVVVLRDCYLV